ncbi:MAG: GNAT family N-acetyltransferase [Maritimibacter sp.]|nr:GNAT family N-acetyltransferase [Maritimibacter sp.]
MLEDSVADQPVIEAGRFALRPPRQGDTGLLSLYAGDKRVARGTRSIPHPLPPGAVEAFVTRALAADREEDVWVLDGGEKGHEVLGVVSLRRMDRNQSQLGYWVAPAMWNTGLASEAVKAMVEANPLDNEILFAEVFQDNPASARVLTNAGFEYIGEAEAHSVSRGANVPTWTYIRRMR